MLEVALPRKNKVNLSDYNCEQDVQNRIFLSDFSVFDLEVLEEILFSPLKISLRKLSRSLDTEIELLRPVLEKFSKNGILAVEGDTLLIDKEMRKYFEFQILRFSSDFRPDMEFIQGILRTVPIHLLPIWYAIPRASNNIFESIVDKYLATPLVYQRYLLDFNFGDKAMGAIVKDLFSSEDLKISSTDAISKYNLSRKEFEEIMLYLEFNFICCTIYEKEDDHWSEWIVPFLEWRDYLTFLKKSEAKPLPADQVEPFRTSPFACIEEMASLLQGALPLSAVQTPYQIRLVKKLKLVKLAEESEGRLVPLEAAKEWLEMSLENRSIYLYRHPLNQILSIEASEKETREAEKAVKRALHGNWILIEDFIKGVLVSFNEESAIVLQKKGRHWRYTLPSYSERERALIRATILEWLFEFGIVQIGSFHGKECFSVTPFGRAFFED